MKSLPAGVLLSALVALSARAPAFADTVQYKNSPSSYPQVRDGLFQEFGVTALPPLVESVQTSYTVPGTGLVDLNFRFKYDVGALLFSFGYYRITPELTGIDLSTDAGKRSYAIKALSPGNATLIFDDAPDDPGAMLTTNASGGETLGFFLLPDVALDEFQLFPQRFAPNGIGSATYSAPPPLRWPLFSESSANPGSLDQMLGFSGVSRVTNRPTDLYAFEDLTRLSIPGNFLPSDNQFNDLLFTIDASPHTPSPRSFPIPIANPSFEADVLNDGFWIDGELTGWNVFGFTAGPQNWTNANYPGATDSDSVTTTVPDGRNGAFIRSPLAGIGQTLDAELEPNTEYRLDFFVGDRFDTTAPFWKAELYAGATRLAVNDTGVTPANGRWLPASLVFATGATNALFGQPLTIRFSTYGFNDPPGQFGFYQVGIDDVRLTATRIPEPTSAIIAYVVVAAWFGRKRTATLCKRGTSR